MCHSRTLTILLVVELSLLTVQVAGFAIRTTSESATSVGPTHTLEVADLKYPKSGPPGSGKIDELQNNEIPSQENSSKTTQKLSTSYDPTTSDEAATTNVPTLNSSSENKSKQSDIQTENLYSNTTPTDDVSTVIESAYSNIFAPLLNESTITSQSENISTSPSHAQSESVSATKFENMFTINTQSQDVTRNAENVSSSIAQVANVSKSVTSENASASKAQLQNMPTNITQPQNVSISARNASSSIVQGKNVSLSVIRSGNTSTTETLLQNVSISVMKVGNVSLSTSEPKNETVSEIHASGGTYQPLNVLASQNDESNDEKFNLFVDHLNFLTNVDTSDGQKKITEDTSTPNNTAGDEMNVTKSTEITYATIINTDNSTGDQMNLTTDAQITNKPTTVEDSAFADKFNLLTNSDIAPSEKVEQMTEADNTSYSPKPVEINDTIAIDTSSGQSVTSKTINDITTTEISSSSSQSATITTGENTSTDTSITEETTNPVSIENNHKEDDETRKSTILNLNSTEESVLSPIYWKKYTVIDRTRLTTEEIDTTTEKDEILQGAGSVQNIENALRGTSDIKSLQQLKNIFLSFDKMSTEQTPAGTLSTESSFTTGTVPEASEKIDNLPQSQSAEPVVVSSLRAGFLDYSSRSTTASETASIEKNTVQGASTDNLTTWSTTELTMKLTPMTETTSFPETQQTTTRTETETPKFNISQLTTKSLDLVDDAIEEELMKEEMMYNSRELSWQKKSEKKNNTTVEPADNTKRGGDTDFDDALAVRPISSERPKTTRLYTVSSNYKPLKKIDVQSPKPFMRDPDDNSWRNESLSSLGIVFKANNSTKPFTQVLKNKTESVWSSVIENYNKEQPALRERLEKVAEMRKSKKKKINQFGETIYSDYEESSVEAQKSVEILTMPSLTKSPTLSPETIRDIINYTTEPPPLTTYSYKQTTPSFEFEVKSRKPTTSKQYDYEEDDETEYTLPNIDIKKYIQSVNARQEASKRPATAAPPTTAPARPAFPERKPTVQYFPPREKTGPVIMNDYDVDFRKVVNQYTLRIPSKQTFPDMVTKPTYRFQPNKYDTASGFSLPSSTPTARPVTLMPPHPSSTAPQRGAYTVDTTDGSYHRGSYVIKHFRDFIDEVIHADENPHSGVTEDPFPAVTANQSPPTAHVSPPKEYYDYEDQFRRNVLSRFMENFNQNSERFKSEFPLLYNTSVVHAAGEGQTAESTAFMRRLYEDARAIQVAGRSGRAGAAGLAPCDRTVELSPDYELHYYVPEQEEREEMQPKLANLAPAEPYRLRL